MNVITSLDQNNFTLNDVPKARVYQMIPSAGVDKVSLVNVFNSKDVLFQDEPIDNLRIDGTTPTTAIEAISLFLPFSANFNRGGTAPKECVLYAEKITSTGFVGLEVEYDTTEFLNIDLDVDIKKLSGGIGEYSCTNFDPVIHSILSSSFHCNTTAYKVVSGDNTGLFTNPNAKLGLQSLDAPADIESNYPIRIVIREK